MTHRSVAPNAPLPDILAGIQQYAAMGIAPSRLIIALPWYGYDFTCAAASPSGGCALPSGSDWYAV